MSTKRLFESETLHHAYFFVGEREETKHKILSSLEKDLHISLQANPDFLLSEFETFGVEDARELKERQEKKPFGDGKKIFVVALNFITTEAQNALLKMFEEPSSDTHFFLIAATDAILLPTLRSRLFIIKDTPSSRKVTDANTFLSASVDERLKIAERFKDAENESKKSELLALVNDIERTLSISNEKDKAFLSELFVLKRFIVSRSPSVKMIAEYLALRLPRVLK